MTNRNASRGGDPLLLAVICVRGKRKEKANINRNASINCARRHPSILGLISLSAPSSSYLSSITYQPVKGLPTDCETFAPIREPLMCVCVCARMSEEMKQTMFWFPPRKPDTIHPEIARQDQRRSAADGGKEDIVKTCRSLRKAGVTLSAHLYLRRYRRSSPLAELEITGVMSSPFFRIIVIRASPGLDDSYCRARAHQWKKTR